MSQADSKGNITLDRNEREVIGATFRLLAASIQEGIWDEIDVVNNIVDDLDLSKAFVYPNHLLFPKRKLKKQDFAALEQGRREFRLLQAPQMLVDLAAEFRVRLEITGTEPNKKW